MNDLPKGFNCIACDEWNPFPTYVYAHWNVPLETKCAICGVKHTVCRGMVFAKKRGGRKVNQ